MRMNLGTVAHECRSMLINLGIIAHECRSMLMIQ